MTEDLHKKNASLIFQKPVEKVTEDERRAAKTALYLFQYNKERGVKPVDSRTEVWFGEQSKEVMDRHNTFLEMHYRALACHCECLGMNAENSYAVCIGSREVPYSQAHYGEAMMKWGLTDEKGQPLI